MYPFCLAYCGDHDFVASLNDDFRKFSCKFIVVVQTSITSSALTLTLLAVERYHAILKPFSWNWRLHEESIKRAIFAIWFLSIARIVPLCMEQQKIFMHWSMGSRIEQGNPNLFAHIFNVHYLHAHSGVSFLLWIPDKRIVFFRHDMRL